MDISKHDDEIQKNLSSWRKKPLLREIYKNFHKQIAKLISHKPDAITVELGSGIGNIKEVIPHCLRTDLFPNPWIDRVENAYQLSFSDNTVDNLILFDVFHHLRYPGTALQEFHRVLTPHGRLIILEPCMSVLGCVVFGLFHHEALGLTNEIQMFAPNDWSANDDGYYAAQGNASRIFFGRKYTSFLDGWTIITKQKMSVVSYVASGGYSMPQLYPDKAYPFMKIVDRVCDQLPSLFATRLLVVFEKKVFAEHL